MQLYQPLRAANKPPAEPAVLIYAVNKAFYLFSGFHLPLSTLR